MTRATFTRQRRSRWPLRTRGRWWAGIGAILVLAFGLVVGGASSLAATSASDPAGDNCAGGYCGPDLTGAADRVDPDGTVHLSITRASEICNTLSYPPGGVQPWFQLLSSSATSQTDTASYVAAVWAVSSTSDFTWSPAGGGADVPLTSTVTPAAVEVVIPASLVSSVGGLPLKWFVNNSCKEFPFEPLTAYKDFTPDSGLYTLAADAPDACPNIAGAQAAVPAGMFVDGSGSCVADQCPNIPGGQSAVPAGMFVDGAGTCVTDQCPNLADGQAGVPPGHAKDSAGNCQPLVLRGTAGANVLIGNSLANLINGLGGNDTLWGRGRNDTLNGGAGRDRLYGETGNDRLVGGAGADLARGGAGPDKLNGGAGPDRLYGDAGNDTLDARDRRPGDIVNGGAGRDTCYYNAGDRLSGCERRIRRA